MKTLRDILTVLLSIPLVLCLIQLATMIRPLFDSDVACAAPAAIALAVLVAGVVWQVKRTRA